MSQVQRSGSTAPVDHPRKDCLHSQDATFQVDRYHLVHPLG